MNRRSLAIFLFASLALAQLAAADHHDDVPLGLRLPGDQVTAEAHPPGTVLTGNVVDNGGWPWTQESLVKYTATVPGSFAGAHAATFAGTYALSGGKGGYPLTWDMLATAHAIKADVKQVAFLGSGHFLITEDDADPLYSQPQWQDNSAPLNRSADEAGDRKYPVGYKRNVKPLIGAIFIASEDLPSGTTVKAKAAGTAGINIPETDCTVSGVTITMPDTESDNALPDSIQYYDTFNFTWKLKFNDGDWVDVGTSKNRMCVTLAAPTQSPIYYSVAYHACRTAVGETTFNAAVPKIWTAFSSGSGPADTRKVLDSHPDLVTFENGSALHYYNPWEDPPANTWPSLTVAGLLKVGNGQCSSWAQLWLHTLMTHGYSGAGGTYIEAPAPYNGFLVKNWDFIGVGSNIGGIGATLGARWLNAPAANWHTGSVYNWRFLDVRDSIGVPGQNSANPQSQFNNHTITKIDGTYYDPSYGRIYTGAAQMTTTAIAGFYVEAPYYDPVEQTTVDAMFIRKTDMGAGYPAVTLVFSP